MANCIEQAKQALDGLLREAFARAAEAGELPAEGERRGSV